MKFLNLLTAIYLHIPFCERKCFYCDFYSIANLSKMDAYVAALKKEIQIFQPVFAPVETIFFGGGAPSLLNERHFKSLFGELEKKFDVRRDCEITVEANPGTIDKNKLRALRRLGANRLSLGVQSFIDEELEFLGRIHNSRQAEQSYLDARDAGFENINLDLIVSTPGQSDERVLYSINRALDLQPEHLAVYSLIYEPGTPLFSGLQSGKIAKNDDDREAEIYSLVAETLEKNGFRQYEISNYSRHGKECRHNLNYWRGGEYCGFGAAARGFLSSKRYWNVSDVDEYISRIASSGDATEDWEFVDIRKALREYIFLSLRTKRLDASELQIKFGIDLFAAAENKIRMFERGGFSTIDETGLNLTLKGVMMCDEISLAIIDLAERYLKY